MDIKAVCFDLDGVYFTQESFQRFKKNISGSKEKELVDYVLYKSKEMMNFKKGIISENEYWDYVRKSLGINISNEEIFDILRNSYETNDKIVDIVRLVKRKGFKTCVCSNNFVTRVRELDKKYNFLQDFDIRVFSYNVGALKPDKKIFEKLIKESNVKPEEILYSDDSPDKLSGANELGINTFIFEDVKKFMNKLTEYKIL